MENFKTSKFMAVRPQKQVGPVGVVFDNIDQNT